ncbi:MAG: uroporphyrinogen-III synthase [Proteobacteria bacterium]|nr:uroporphyrinogen-III synthase [Pseudomonadota bacterium]
MRVLITQPAQEAAISARALAARGHEPIIIPLVTVERESAPAINLASAQGFLATSPEGVRALADHVGVRTFPIFVDSDLTAAEARRLGFKDVQAAKDDSQDLARLVERALKPANGALVYACNTAAPVNLGAMLGNMGFAVRPLPLYSIKRVAEIPQELRAKLESKGIDVALFMSPDEARAFVTLIQRDETAPPITGLKTVTATPAIAAPLRALKGASVTVASASDPDSVWATLDGELIDKVEEERRERERKIKEEEARRRAEEERERIAREKAAAEHIERERLEVERQRIAKEEAERVELERLAREEERRVRAEDERRRKEEAERVRAEKLAREKAEKEERDRLRAEEKARAKAERERLAAEKAAQEQAGRARLAAERAERERLKAEEAARAKAEKEERDRLRAEEETRAKAERERLAAEKAAQEQAGRARLAAERAERERLKAEEAARAKAEKDRLAAERAAREDAERERLRKEKEERERLRAEEEARQRLEKERLAAERAEQERLRKEREDRERAERAEQERLRKEQEARERAERDRIAAEQAAHEKAEREQRAREKAARDEAEHQRLAAERAAWEEAERVQRAAEKAERERLDAERHERERIAREAREKERAEKERLAREEAERVRAEKVRIAAEREKERLEKERGAREEAERARAEAARLAAAREEERLERMRTAREEADRARAEKERLANARAEADRIARQKREEEERIEREKRAETARLENERLAREKTERERLKTEQAAQEAERKRILKEEAAAQKARDEQARREEAAAARAAQERLAQELAERRRAEKEEAGRAQAERKRLANEQKAQAKAEKARMAAERKPSGGWFSSLFGKPAAPADPAPDPRWNMVVSHDPPSPTDPPAAIASAAPSWNDTPMTDPVRETKDNPPVPVPSALQELDELVARESHGKESAAESLADAKPAARSGGGRSAQMQAEDAADERMRDRLASWGRGEPETPQPHDGEQADPVPEAAVAPPPVRRRGAGRSIALFFVLATIATAAMMTSHRWLPLLVKEPPAPVASAPAPNAPAPTPPQVKPAPPAVAPAPSAPVAPAAQPAAPSLGDTSNQTIAALMARVATLEAALGNTARLDEINRRVESLAGRSADANSVLALADRVTALEQAGRSAADQRAVAVALTIAATQWRDAVVTGRPFLKEWDTVKALSGQSQTDTVFAKYAGTGLPTLAEMQRRLDVAAAAAVRASYLPNDTASWLRRTLDRVFSVISVRRTDVDTGDGVDAIFVRAERAAEGGNLAAAVAEMKKLTGAPLAAVTPWIELAEARVAAEEAAQESVIAGATTLAQPSATPAAAASAAKAE